MNIDFKSPLVIGVIAVIVIGSIVGTFLLRDDDSTPVAQTPAPTEESTTLEKPAESNQVVNSQDSTTDDGLQSAETPPTTSTSNPPADSETAVSNFNQYVPVENWNDNILQTSPGTRQWLYFHADWCPICIRLDEDINNNLDLVPSDVVIYKIDYDANQALRDEYGVKVQTTVVALENKDPNSKVSHQAANDPTLAALIQAFK